MKCCSQIGSKKVQVVGVIITYHCFADGDHYCHVLCLGPVTQALCTSVTVCPKGAWNLFILPVRAAKGWKKTRSLKAFKTGSIESANRKIKGNLRIPRHPRSEILQTSVSWGTGWWLQSSTIGHQAACRCLNLVYLPPWETSQRHLCNGEGHLYLAFERMGACFQSPAATSGPSTPECVRPAVQMARNLAFLFLWKWITSWRWAPMPFEWQNLSQVRRSEVVSMLQGAYRHARSRGSYVVLGGPLCPHWLLWECAVFPLISDWRLFWNCWGVSANGSAPLPWSQQVYFSSAPIPWRIGEREVLSKDLNRGLLLLNPQTQWKEPSLYTGYPTPPHTSSGPGFSPARC